MTNWSVQIPENQLLLHQHVIRTLLYYDIFNYPLKSSEVFRFLGMNSVTESDVAFALTNLEQKGAIYKISEYYCIKPAEDDVHRRIKGNKTAESFLDLARRQALFIASFPFVRGVLVSGSLSKGYMDEKSDLDFFIITAPRRLWIARTLLVMYKRLFLFNSHKFFCVNYFVDEDHPEIEEKNLFTATELATVIPFYGSQQYQQLIGSNVWLTQYFPNFKPRSTTQVPTSASTGIKKVMEGIIN
ncbi:MAG TPA: hypothetical protein VK666_11805, partial [Chryseolinea sp.]|nr:hypothetical protein [Chryseolinea sp.]